MWDAGLRGTAETRLGFLVNALLRNCRYLAAIGLHTQGMTARPGAEPVPGSLLSGRRTRRRRRPRAARIDPGYLNYTLNKLMIMRLRADWTATRGGRAAWKAFHDQLLSFGGPPIPLVRAAMLGGAAQAAF